MDIRAELKKRAAAVNAAIEKYLPAEEGFASDLARAMNYSMRAGGKRIRPVLVLESFGLFEEADGAAEDRARTARAAETLAVSLEMIHTHSLIHDDLPAIDNDDLRRGKPTTHAKFGEALGLLAGDALLNYAYETALSALRTDHASRVPGALQILAEKTGIRGMLGGQSVDVQNEKRGETVLPREQLDAIYLCKTSALLEAALMIGAALGGADEEQVGIMEQIGRRLGLAFQIRDDILDVTSDTETLGKPVLSDEKNEKTTYVTLLGVEGAEAETARLTEEAAALIEKLPGDTAFLRELVRYLAVRDN